MAHEYRATIIWTRQPSDDFPKGRYSRAHEIRFDGGITIVGSASPSVVPLPFSREDAVDPEEMFVAALSNCHMLTFIDLARRAGLVIDAYEDEAIGTMERIAPQKMAITKVTLRPKIAYGSAPPDQAKLDELHHQAHELCFIANSVKTEITVEARS
jgi:organic hydroperoxide reductase OsmC/OhrA